MSESPQAADAQVASALRTHGSMTRHEIVQITGLSMASVNRSVGRLSASSVVVPAGRQLSTGGRPPELLAYNGAGLMAVGISVRESGADGLLLSLDGEIVARDTEEFDQADEAETRLEQTLDLLDRMLGRPEGQVCGVGVAVPAVVSPSGRLTAIHELGWDRLALGDLLARRAGMPVMLDNDGNCLAVGEHLRGAGRGVDNLIAVVVSSGLGAGLIANGQLYRGRHHEAGEIGYLLTGRDSLRRLFPDRGDLEQSMGTERLIAKATELGLALPQQATLSHLISLGLHMGGAVRDFAEELLDLAALAVASMCVVLDPELVIIGGYGDRSEMEQMVAGIHERLLGRILRVPRIETTTLGADAVVIGAAQLALPAVV